MADEGSETVTLRKSTLKLAALVLIAFIAGYLVGGITVPTGKITDKPVQAPAPEDEQAVQAPPRISVGISGQPSLGDKSAKIVIAEFTDFQCPFCKRAHDTSFLQLKKDYVDTGKVLYVVRDYPLPFHTEADDAAEAANCAFEQGTEQFWKMYDLLFEKQTEWAGSPEPRLMFKGYGTGIGLNAEQFSQCMDSGKYQAAIQHDISDGSSYGVSGTPAFFINGIELVGAQPYSAFKAIIEQELSS